MTHFDPPHELGRPGAPIPPEDRPSLQLATRRRIVIPVPVAFCLLAVAMVAVITVWVVWP